MSALRLSIASPSAPGPGLIPFGAALLLIFFSLGTIAEALLTNRREAVLPDVLTGRSWAVSAVLAVLFLYALFMPSLGFVIATLLALICLFKLSVGQTWKRAIGASLLTTLLTYLLFSYALGLFLPQGVLEFTGF